MLITMLITGDSSANSPQLRALGCPNQQSQQLIRMRTLPSSDSFSRRFLDKILQLSLVKYPLELLGKASAWIGLVLPVSSIRDRLCPPSRSPGRAGLLARKRRGKLQRLLLSVTPASIQSLLGCLPMDWGQSSAPREIREAPINPDSKGSKRKRDDVALEQHESWLVVLERDWPEEDSEDPTYEPSEVETDSEEYQSQNDTDLELEEQGELPVLEPSAAQGSVLPPEPAAEAPAVASGGEEAPAVASGGEEAPAVASGGEEAPAVASGGDISKQEADTTCVTPQGAHDPLRPACTIRGAGGAEPAGAEAQLRLAERQ
ncbi:uncharacterized protein LOC130264290 [Oenanthe melanoleuca]|uniref:uncharacterized protein LOC130264290 n=1 Tax=Oenanthe melanoleuca TaxID=2939378 RepID=UPI0024C1DF56|nr:uncharacterized protein LOC130264290 [Oenanthe melanoleuca]